MTQRAVLLAAGRGTRLGPLTEQTPKCLLQINGRTMLDRQLEALAGAGIKDVTVVAGFMAEAVVRHVANRCRVLVNEHYATTDSITSLALAAPYLHGHGFLLQNGDTLYPVDLIRRLQTVPRENACLVDSVRPHRPGEYHIEVADGRVVRYSNALPPERSVGESAQLLRVGAGDSAAFLDRIAKLMSSNGSKGFPNQAYDVLMNGQGLWPVFTAGLPWWEIDAADDLSRCNAEHLSISQTVRSSPAPLVLKKRVTGVRIARFVKSLPWRFRWAPPAIRPLFRHPVLVTREVRAFRAGQLSLPGLDLAVNGASFLRLAYSEAQALGFQPFLLWGTLLGCIRNGGFIKGDQDIDLGVMAADAGRLPEFRQRLMRRGFGVRIENECKLSLVHPRHPRLYIDIDVVRPHRDGWAITNKDADPQKKFHYYFPAGVFASTQTAAFTQSLMVRVPQDAQGFLAAAYGHWQTPAPKVDYRYGPLNTEVELVSNVGSKKQINLRPIALGPAIAHSQKSSAAS
jgi:choline kinase